VLAAYVVVRNPQNAPNMMAESIGFATGAVVFTAMLIWIFLKLAPRENAA
jgi:hypothetical protein